MRERIHRQISGQRYTNEEIEDIVEDEAGLSKKQEEDDKK